MTPEQYVMERLLQLELENQQLKEEIEQLKSDKTVCFHFETKDMPKHTYKVEFEDGQVKVAKEELL